MRGVSLRALSAMSGPMRERMIARFTAAFAPTHLEVIDESAAHAEHEAMRAAHGYAETHFVVRVVSARFAGVAPVQRHRMVYAALGEDEMARNGLHALRIEARTPEEYAARLQK